MWQRHFLRDRPVINTNKLILNNKNNGHDHDQYLILLSRGDLTVSGLAFTDFNFQTFSILHYISPAIHEMAKKKASEKLPATFYQKI